MTNVATRREKGRAREETVLQAAAQAIAELGLAQVRVADIAERAGIGPGHVSYYFPSKDELLMRAIRWSEQELHEQIAAQIHRIADPWKRLRRLFELAAPQGPGDPGWLLWFAVWAEATTDRDVATGSIDLESWWRTALTDAIRYGFDLGAFATDDVGDVTLVLSALIDGLSIQATLGTGYVTRRRLLDLCDQAAHRYLDVVETR